MLLLAWRNLWRNRRRSLITVTSLGCGLAAIMFGQSMIKTIQYQLIEKATGVITGHLQIQDSPNKNYKFPEKPIENVPEIEAILGKSEFVDSFEQRIIITGLISSKVDSLGILVVGVQPERDVRVTTMHTYIHEGNWLSGKPKEIVLGDTLADKMKVRLGDKVVVMAQAVDGSMGAENFTLVGITHSGSETFDESIAYVPLETLQDMLAMNGRANDFVVRLKNPDAVRAAQASLAAALSGMPVKAVSWEEVDQELVGVQKYQNAIMNVMLMIIFVIVALGILNTLLMSILERVREFGVVMAIGARPGWVLRLVVTESCLLGALGGVAGLCLGSALIIHYHRAGLELPLGDAIGFFIPFDSNLHMRFVWESHRTALLAVVITCVLASLPPAVRASRLRPADAIRHL